MAPRKKRRPATTVQAREHQLISLAIERAEQQLLDGTASSQVIVHFLKLASTREALEQKRLEQENLMIAAKISAMTSNTEIKDMYENALKAMRAYNGDDSDEQDIL